MSLSEQYSADFIKPLQDAGSWLATHQPSFVAYGIKLIVALTTVLIGCYFAKLARSALLRLVSFRDTDQTIVCFIADLLWYTVLTIAVIVALAGLGVQTGSLIAMLGGGILAIGLALRNSLSNFAAGILLIILRPFKVNNFVQIGGTLGTVQVVNLFSTSLRTPDNILVIVPNNNIVTQNIINYSYQSKRRVDVRIELPLDKAITAYKAILHQLISSDQRILIVPKPLIQVVEISASTLTFMVGVWVNSEAYWPVYFDLLEKSATALTIHKVGLLPDKKFF